jgi:lipoate-protein ligase A
MLQEKIETERKASYYRLFDRLVAIQDREFLSAALNMAIDEALLEIATGPTIRFYRWNHPALSFGYFGKYDDVADQKDEREIVRRWTGGGIVFHGNDLTYSIVIPVSDAVFSQSSMLIYEKVHHAMRDAFAQNGVSAELSSVSALYESRRNNAPVIDRRYSECFANPVRADVLLNGRKVAGAAQRRTRRGLLQQGSIQKVDLGEGFAGRFANELSNNWRLEEFSDALLTRAQAIAEQKYSTPSWLRRR